LQAEAQDGALAEAAKLIEDRLADGGYFEAPKELDDAARALEATYHELYTERHGQRTIAFTRALDDVKAQPNWVQVPEATQAAILKPLADRAGHELALPKDGLTCAICSASLAEMASDLSAVARLRSDVLLRVQQLTEPEQKVERLRFSDVAGVGKTLSNDEDIEELVEQLRDRLRKLIAAGVKIVLE